MQIIQPYAKMISPRLGYATMNLQFQREFHDDTFTLEDGIACLRRIEYFARISHRSEEAISEDSYKRIIEHVVRSHGDWSVVEHASVSVEAVVDRGVTHEWVRHRLFSYTQESTRFVNYVKKMPPSFVRPPFTPEQNDKGANDVWDVQISSLEAAYKKLVDMGVAPQIARGVFPNSLSSKIAITGNFRHWRHFFIMRTSKEAHPQMKQVTIPLLKEFQAKIPMLFEDIEPEQRQADIMKLLR